jgi:hypothetical protein
MHALFAFALLLQAGSDKTTVKVESTLEVDIVVRDGSGEATKLLNVSRKDQFSQERVDARTVRLKVVSSRVQRSGTDTPLEEKASPLAGNTYVATRTDAGWNVQDAAGGAAPVEGQHLGAWNDMVRILPPGGSVSAGAKWTVDSKEILPLIYPGGMTEGQGRLECTCQSVEGGRANIMVTGTMSGKGADPNTLVTLAVKTGTLIYDTARNRPVSLILSGSLESATDMVELIRKPNTNEEERRKVGEISLKSRRLEAVLSFE